MTVQLIDRKKLIFRIENIEYHFVKPYFLYKDFGIFIEAKLKGSTLGWYINNEFLSYNQLKRNYDIYINTSQPRADYIAGGG